MDSEFLWVDGMGSSDCEMIYEDIDIEGVVLPPSVAVTTFEAAEILTIDESEEMDDLALPDNYLGPVGIPDLAGNHIMDA